MKKKIKNNLKCHIELNSILNDETQIPKKHSKYSTYLAIGEMQVNTSLISDSIPFKMSKINKINDMLVRERGKQNAYSLLVGM